MVNSENTILIPRADYLSDIEKHPRGQLVWYREIVPGDAGEKPWLQTGAYGDPWIFSESSIIRIPAGGFIRKSGDTTMHFPV